MNNINFNTIYNIGLNEAIEDQDLPSASAYHACILVDNYVEYGAPELAAETLIKASNFKGIDAVVRSLLLINYAELAHTKIRHIRPKAFWEKRATISLDQIEAAEEIAQNEDRVMEGAQKGTLLYENAQISCQKAQLTIHRQKQNLEIARTAKEDPEGYLETLKNIDQVLNYITENFELGSEEKAWINYNLAIIAEDFYQILEAKKVIKAALEFDGISNEIKILLIGLYANLIKMHGATKEEIEYLFDQVQAIDDEQRSPNVGFKLELLIKAVKLRLKKEEAPQIEQGWGANLAYLAHRGLQIIGIKI